MRIANQRQYVTMAAASGGKEGRVKTQSGSIDLELRTPKKLGGKGGGANTAQLFAAAYAACYNDTLNDKIKKAQLMLPEVEVEAYVTTRTNPKGEYTFEVALEVDIPNTKPTIARYLMEQAYQACPLTKAVKNNIKVELHLK